MEAIEVFGLICSFIIVVSMTFKTTTLRGTLSMRGLNALGSAGFFIYGIALNAISVWLLNGFTFLFNVFYFIKELIDSKQEYGK